MRSIIGSTLHSRPVQLGAIYMHNHDDKIQPDWDLNLVPPGHKSNDVVFWVVTNICDRAAINTMFNFSQDSSKFHNGYQM